MKLIIDENGSYLDYGSYRLPEESLHACLFKMAYGGELDIYSVKYTDPIPLLEEANNDILRRENAELRKKVDMLKKSLMNAAGDNLCWIGPTALGKIPPRAEFLESCARYHAQIAHESGELQGCKTIAQLEAENEGLREGIAELSEQARDCMRRLFKAEKDSDVLRAIKASLKSWQPE